MLKKLRIKFVCINMIIVTVMMCVIFGLVIHFTGSSMEIQSINMMQKIAADPQYQRSPEELPDSVRLPYFTLQIGNRGEIVSAAGGYYDLSDEDFLNTVLEVSLQSDEITGVLDEYNLRFCRAASPYGQYIVFADMTSEQTTLNNLIKTCLAIGAASFLVFLVISIFLANWAVKPVERAWSQQKQFVADASHELKTPLTVILTNAEMLQNSSCSQNSTQQFSKSILVMSRQMRGLVENLLELARVDSGEVKKLRAELDLSQLVIDAVLPFEPLYFEKGLDLNYSVESGIKVRGSEEHLKQVVDILLDNAMKYSTEYASVTVNLKKQGGHTAVLSAANPGRPISDEDLENIFKRFYRIDYIREMNRSYGLGLSIAEGIVKDHNGKIWAESEAGINTFYVVLPAVI